jgi:thymidylate kinase
LDAHPLLRRLFAALEARRVLWVLLRLPSNFARPTGDVDLLVAPEEVDRLLEVAEELGFVALPGWESPPGLILVGYDRPSDHWVVLDVATAVSFRSPGSWELPGAAREVLGRRHLHDGAAVPSDDETFWLLLAHCLLDDGGVPAHYRGALQALAPLSSGSFVGRAVLSAAGDRVEPVAFEEAAQVGDWGRLMEMGARLVADLKRERSVVASSRATAKRAIRVARKPLLLRRRRGLSVALLGPNGVGKSTVAAGLQQGFPLGARVVHMGLWKTPATRPGARAVEILTRPLRLWGRSAVAHYHQARGRLVIYDRYVYEARLPAKPPLLAAKRLYFWVLGHAIPPPDAAVVLDVAGDVAYGRKQENPPEELESERRVYANLAASEPSIELVDASKPPDAVLADVTAIVWAKVAARWARGRAGCEPAAD